MLLESKTVRVIFGWKILILLVFSGASEAQQGPTRTEVQAQDRSAEIVEIEELREKIGGGVGEIMGEWLDPKAAQKEFALELERLSDESKRLPAVKPKYQLVSPRPLGVVARPKMRPKMSRRSLCHSIARKLDGITADLEEAGYYDEADSMRDLAGSYWSKARKLQPVWGEAELLRLPPDALKEKK